MVDISTETFAKNCIHTIIQQTKRQRISFMAKN